MPWLRAYRTWPPASKTDAAPATREDGTRTHAKHATRSLARPLTHPPACPYTLRTLRYHLPVSHLVRAGRPPRRVVGRVLARPGLMLPCRPAAAARARRATRTHTACKHALARSEQGCPPTTGREARRAAGPPGPPPAGRPAARRRRPLLPRATSWPAGSRPALRLRCRPRLHWRVPPQKASPLAARPLAAAAAVCYAFSRAPVPAQARLRGRSASRGGGGGGARGGSRQGA